MNSKTESVKSLFEIPEKYLGPREFDIKIRSETVRQLTETLTIDRTLDIGCGNGALSLPLLPRCQKLTMLDLSRNMIELARNRVPVERAADVDLIEGDFVSAKIEPGTFDLILCVGVLAHVDSPSAVIAKVAQLAKPGSWVILEFTDSFHLWSAPVIIYQTLLRLIKPAPYRLNRLKRQNVLEWCRQNNLLPSRLFRYALPPIGASTFANQEEMYHITRRIFGVADHNRNRWVGNEFIYLLQKTDPRGLSGGNPISEPINRFEVNRS